MKEKCLIYWLIIDKPLPNLQYIQETLASVTRQSLEWNFH